MISITITGYEVNKSDLPGKASHLEGPCQGTWLHACGQSGQHIYTAAIRGPLQEIPVATPSLVGKAGWKKIPGVKRMKKWWLE